MIEILIMDDSNEKIESLKNVILPIFQNGEILIEVANSLVEGRTKMQDKTYDLLILDMVMPEHDGEDSSQTAGADYLNEIYENQSIKVPVQIIGLTEYEEKFAKQQKDFKDKLWYLLFYSRAETNWKKMLKSKILQLGQFKKAMEESIENKNKYDVAIICALSKEYKQMIKAFSTLEWRDLTIEGLPYCFKTTTLTTRKFHELRIITSCADKAGVCATSILSSVMYNIFHVDTLFMTGFTAGVENGDLRLNDVVIAESIHDYASGKINEDSDGNIKLLKEINQITTNHSLIAKASEFISNREYISRINDNVHDMNLINERDNISFITAKTVCGPFVMASATIVKSLKDDERKLQALDMEGFALYLTAHTLDKKALWIKGVSDFADSKKEDSHQTASAYSSARFLFEFLREML